jgi:hypothetical protein
VLEGFDADILAGFFLIAHINMRSRIITDQNHRQPGRHIPTALQALNFGLDLLLYFFGNGFAVDDSRHELTPDPCGNYIGLKLSVKDYLKHLDDMESWKGQQEAQRFQREILKRGFDRA